MRDRAEQNEILSTPLRHAEAVSPLRRAVLFCHGFMGSPRQFAWLLPVAARCGYEAFTVTLPGHEADASAFFASDDRQWLRELETRIDALRLDYDRIVLVGHSMGGLLEALSAASNPDRIQAVFALAFPLKIRMTWRAVRQNVRTLFPRRDGEDLAVTCAREWSGVRGLTVWNAMSVLPNSLRLLRVVRKARAALPHLGVPLTVVQSGRDELVPPSALRLVQRLLPKAQAVLLPESGHVRYSEADRLFVAGMLGNLLSEGDVAQ